MEDSSQKRMSAIPRLSKLPLPRPTSGIPKPTSALPRPASTIRPSPSRESLGGELRNPRLRPSLSRDQLRTGQPDLQQRAQRLRPTASREQLNTGTRRTSLISRAPTQLSPAKPPAKRVPSTPHRSIERQADIIEEQSTTPPYDPPGEAIGVEYDGHIFPRQLTLTRRPSEVFAVSPLYDPANNIFDPNNSRPPTASTDDDDRFDTIRARPRKARPSLSERTIETLANIPSSPALSKKSSTNFFDQGRSRSRAGSRPRSRADSGASRPGSSYASDASTRLSSKPGSRPGSSSGQSDHGFANFRASASAYRPPLTTIDGTPQKRSSAIVNRTPNSRVQGPSPGKPTMPTPKSGSKSVAARPAKPRAPVKGLFKKPSLPALGKNSLNGGADRRVSVNSSSTGSWDGTIPSSASSHNTSLTAESAEPGTPPSARKSSAALREQIAKAKAAKRAQMKAASEIQTQTHQEEEEAPIVPSDTGFDFGVNHDDPFNLNRGQDPKKKVLQNRVSTARTTGRLNIAALHLKEIPVEVLKMYDLESIGTFDGSWAESVDLTRFVAADNELEELDDFIFPDSNPGSFDEAQASQGNIFAGLETLDMHGNLLVNVPLGFRRLTCLTSLNLSSNRLTNNSLDTISQVSSLRDLKLANNLFYGPLNPILSSLSELEILDVHGNNISALPSKIENMSRLRILNLSENSFESLPFDSLASLPITELNVRKNKLKGTLIEEPIGCLPQLHTLDASLNQLERLVPLGSAIDLPVLHSLSLSMNRLQGLPDMTTWTNLLTLSVEENSISGIPNSFMSLEKLRHADFSSNDIRVIPPEVSRMDNLTMMRLSGNPLRDKKFVSITTEDLKEVLAGRLEPPPPYQEPAAQVSILDILSDAKVADANTRQPSNADASRFEEDDYRSDDDFATPPQSPSRSRSHTVSSRRSRSHTLSNQTWPVKPGGILDRSQTESSSLHPVVCSKVAAEHRVRQVFLQNNLFATLPNSLSFFAETLTALSLSHNQLLGEAYLTEDLELPALREISLASNHITGLGALTRYLHAPALEKIDVSLNRVNSLPMDLKEAFPSLNVLLASNNHIVDLEPEMITGLKIVDVSSNDIAHLNPRIGLLGGSGGLERFEVSGNRFRVPRWNVIERGTDATLRWLRGRVPVAEMASWQGDDEEPEVD